MEVTNLRDLRLNTVFKKKQNAYEKNFLYGQYFR
jgi:hypothetical protein